MTEYYLDPINGDDANNGSSWALRKKTLEAFSGIAVAGDNIRLPRTHSDFVDIPGGAITTANSGVSTMTAGASVGCLEVEWLNDTSVITGYNSVVVGEGSASSYNWGTYANDTSNGPKTISTIPQTTNTKLAVLDLGSDQDLSSYETLVMGIALDSHAKDYLSPSADENMFRVKLCSDALGDVVLQEWPLHFNSKAYNVGIWSYYLGTGNALPSNVRSIAIYTGANAPNSTSADLIWRGVYAITSTCQVCPGDWIAPKIPGRERLCWYKVARVIDGTTASPTIWPNLYASASGQIINGTYTWEAIRPEHWTSQSDFTVQDLLTGWILDNMAATFTDVTLIGGHDPTTGAPGAGYFMLDFGMGLNIGRHQWWLYMTVARNLALKYIMFGSGSQNGTPIEYQQFNSADIPVRLDYEDVHVFGSLIYQGEDIEIQDNSLLYRCSMHGGNSNHYWCARDAGTEIKFEQVYIHNGYAQQYFQCNYSGDWVWKDCWFGCNDDSMDFLMGSLTTQGRMRWEGTNTFFHLGACDIIYYSPFDTPTDFGKLVFEGSLLNLYPTGNMLIDGLEFHSGVNGYDLKNAYVRNSDVLHGHSSGNLFTNWFIDYATTPQFEGGTYENCTIYWTGYWNTNDDEAVDVHMRNCTLGYRDSSSIAYIRNYYVTMYLYGCTLQYINYDLWESRGTMEMVGGNVIEGTDDFIGLNPGTSSAYFYSGHNFHNVSFTNYDVEDIWWTQNNWADPNAANNYFSPFRNLVFSGYDGNPTDTIVVSPYIKMKTSTDQLHTAGGRSWHVKSKLEIVSEGVTKVNKIQVALRANLLTTISYWVYQVDADSYCILMAEPEQIGTGQTKIRMINTQLVGQWQQITETFTPNADGVLELYFTFSMPANTGELFYDDVSITQE